MGRTSDKTEPAPLTLAWLFNQYFASPEFDALRPQTKTSYRNSAGRIIKYKPRQNEEFVFGSAKLPAIKRSTIRNYTKSRAARGAPMAGNAEVTLIKIAWNWALDEGLIELANPGEKVRRNAQKPRTRYITDDEYRILFDIAGSFPRIQYLQPAMELARLCAMRREEILGARMSQVWDDGFQVKRLKGSRDTLVLWSPRLLAAIELCRATHGKIKSIKVPDDEIYLLQNGHGNRINYGTFGVGWNKLKNIATEQGIENFKFHDLKAKAITDSEDDKRKFGGHRSQKINDQYNRGIDKVSPSE